MQVLHASLSRDAATPHSEAPTEAIIVILVYGRVPSLPRCDMTSVSKLMAIAKLRFLCYV